MLFTVAERWEQAKRPSMHNWVHKAWSTHTVRTYWALRKLTEAVMWRKLGAWDIVLSATWRSQKEKYQTIPLIGSL